MALNQDKVEKARADEHVLVTLAVLMPFAFVRADSYRAARLPEAVPAGTPVW